MARIIWANSAGFERELTRLLGARLVETANAAKVVRKIVQRVRVQGDKALLAYTHKFDKVKLTPQTMRMSQERLEDAAAKCPSDVYNALMIAAQRIRDYHEAQKPQDVLYEDAMGTRLGWKWSPVEAVGLYVPGGLASYPSSVLMNAIPAKVAGCQRLVMTVPAPKGQISDAVLAAANIAEVDEVYTVGGAQAIAALTFGTATIKPVDKIVGPGNNYVAEAKRQVYGLVGIDTIAGPSELLVVASGDNDPRWIAADLLSQAEHDVQAQSILISDDDVFANKVVIEMEKYLEKMDRVDIARASWEAHGAVILVDDIRTCHDLINRIAPEHLELCVEHPSIFAQKVTHAGAIFLGTHTPEAIGDYVAGPSHVLPTMRAARFSSGLSVYDFLKKSSLIGCTPESVKQLANAAEAIALSEGLGAHALSVRLRKEH